MDADPARATRLSPVLSRAPPKIHRVGSTKSLQPAEATTDRFCAPSKFPPSKFKSAFNSSAFYSSVEGGFNETIVQAWCQSQTRWRQDIALDPIIYGGIGTSIFFKALIFQLR